MQPGAITRTDPLAELRAAITSSGPLEALSPDTYARDHAAFETCSNQRGLIADWLEQRLTASDSDPLSVLAVGCGDGELDAEVAGRLVNPDGPQRSVRYVGVEPFEVSAALFTKRMGSISRVRLSVDTVVAPFDEAIRDEAIGEAFNVVTFVHSMYYVPDVAQAALDAYRLLSVGGEVVVLSAPRGALNLLAGLLAPPIEGHRQWFSDDVRAGLKASGLDVESTGTIDGVVDLTEATDDVLDFTVQARLTPMLRGLVRTYLTEVSVVEGRSVVPHPVDTYVMRRG